MAASIFAGDSAHQVSPFGARGANSGLEDGENLAWKLAMVLRGEAPAGLAGQLRHRARARRPTKTSAHSTRSTDFIAPHSRQERRLRQAVLALAKEADFAKRMVNGGRLSVPSVYDTPLSSADVDAWAAGPRPGASMPDAPLRRTSGEAIYLTEAFRSAGGGFVLLESANGAAVEAPEGVGRDPDRRRCAAAGSRQDRSPRATMRRRVLPICCVRMAMSPRASGIRRKRRSRRRWRAPAGGVGQ